MSTAHDFRRIALSLTGATEGAHMGHPDFRAHGRIFATLTADEVRGMVSFTPEQQQRFVAEHPAAFAPVNGTWGRQGATVVHLDQVDHDTLGEAMTLAWQNAAARAGSCKPRATRRKPAAKRKPRRK